MEYRYKIILCGDGGVGKTTFVKRHKNMNFDGRYIPTSGVEISTIKRKINNNREVILDIYDCAGQEKLQNIHESYWSSAQGLIAMYDINSDISFQNIHDTIARIKNIAGEIPEILCGNKIDCDKKIQDYQISKKIIQTFISAKDNYNLDEPLIYLIQNLIDEPNAHFKYRN